jgi:intracellular sulfur oxidation DsrE/DsrF family protein
METNRAQFLAAAAAGTAVIAASAAPALAAGTYDTRAMMAALHKSGRHHHIIGSPKLNGIAPLRSAAHIMGAYAFAFGEGPGTVRVIVSLYGPSSILMLMNDDFWAKYKAYELSVNQGDMPAQILKQPRNPYLHANSSLNEHDSPEDDKGFYHDYTVEALTRRGVTWFVCNEAMHTASRQLAAMGDGDGDPAKVLAALRAHVLPGAIIVPSGSQALVVAQELHYTYQAA